MPINLASPGIVVREVDLTIGRVDATSGGFGAIVAPFSKGPVDEPLLVQDEAGLLDNFGEPYETDKHYEHWLVASSYLAYGGGLRVVRADDTELVNAFVGAATSVKIKSTEHYGELGYDNNTITDVTFAARNPGSWGNGLRVATIDSLGDQVLTGINGAVVGMGITQTFSATLPKAGSTETLDGHLKGIITDVTGTNVTVKVISHVSSGGTETAVDYQASGIYKFDSSTLSLNVVDSATVGYTTAVTGARDWFNDQTLTLTGAGSTISWSSISERPGTSSFAAARDARFDEVHVVVIDGEGEVTGNPGTILERHLNFLKAKDAEYSLGSTAYWRKYLYNASTQVFGGSEPAGIVTTGFSSGFTRQADQAWDQNAQGIIFGASGSNTYSLGGGKNYDGGTDLTVTGALTSTLGKLSEGYGLFEKLRSMK